MSKEYIMYQTCHVCVGTGQVIKGHDKNGDPLIITCQACNGEKEMEIGYLKKV